MTSSRNTLELFAAQVLMSPSFETGERSAMCYAPGHKEQTRPKILQAAGKVFPVWGITPRAWTR